MTGPIEKIVIDHLTEALSVTVAPEIPEGPPEDYVTVEKTGQYEEDGLMTAHLVLRSASVSMYRAILLDFDVRAAMRRLPEKTNIFRCQLENSYNDTVTTMKQRQYLSEFEIVFKEDN